MIRGRLKHCIVIASTTWLCISIIYLNNLNSEDEKSRFDPNKGQNTIVKYNDAAAKITREYESGSNTGEMLLNGSDHLDQLTASLGRALSRHATSSSTIILPCVVDQGYIEMAINYYEYNVRRLNITRGVLFICVDGDACRRLASTGAPTHLLFQDPDGNAGHDFYSESFRRKAATKLDIGLRALRLGYHILITDLDVIFFVNPLDKLLATSGPTKNQQECDLHIQVDRGVEMNSGFMFVRSSSASVNLFQLAVDLMTTRPNYDQEVVNEAIRLTLSDQSPASSRLCVRRLSTAEYPSAIYYFDRPRRFYANVNGSSNNSKCQRCVAMHNNWLVGVAPKIYRLKEHLMWWTDAEGYYSDSSRRYMTYDNAAAAVANSGIKPSPDDDMVLQERALVSALAIALITNRTLILPRYRCHFWLLAGMPTTSPAECPLYMLHGIKNFDSQFGNMYRESTFLHHPKTDRQLKQRHTHRQVVMVTSSKLRTQEEKVGQVQLYVSGQGQLTESEVKSWHEHLPSDARLLSFPALHNVTVIFDTHKLARQLRFSRGLTPPLEYPRKLVLTREPV
jgi:hypothetical protein